MFAMCRSSENECHIAVFRVGTYSVNILTYTFWNCAIRFALDLSIYLFCILYLAIRQSIQLITYFYVTKLQPGSIRSTNFLSPIVQVPESIAENADENNTRYYESDVYRRWWTSLDTRTLDRGRPRVTVQRANVIHTDIQDLPNPEMST